MKKHKPVTKTEFERMGYIIDMHTNEFMRCNPFYAITQPRSAIRDEIVTQMLRAALSGS